MKYGIFFFLMNNPVWFNRENQRDAHREFQLMSGVPVTTQSWMAGWQMARVETQLHRVSPWHVGPIVRRV